MENLASSLTPAPSPNALTRSRKAAMVVQLLLREGQDLPLSQLPEGAQARLTRELGALNIIDKATLQNVAQEFTDELSDVGLTPPGSVEAALQSLDGRISATTAAQLREEAAALAGSDPWALVIGLPVEKMLPITEAECAEVSAILLSKLPTQKAATLLGQIPGERARRIALAVSRTTNITTDAIERIGKGLAQNYCAAHVPAFTETAESRVGAILNSSPALTRDQILEGLFSQDPTFGEGVRKAIFTFADIPARVAALDVPKVMRDVDPSEAVTAMASARHAGGPLAEATDYLLDNMSSRMADAMREEMELAGTIKTSAGEAAQNAIITVIRASADTGGIVLMDNDDDDDD